MGNKVLILGKNKEYTYIFTVIGKNIIVIKNKIIISPHFGKNKNFTFNRQDMIKIISQPSYL